MRLIDSHSHLFLEEFAEDLPQVMARAREAGVGKVFLPAIDIKSTEAILDVCRQYPGYAYPMVGLHPEEVRADWRDVLAQMKQYLKPENRFIAIGEVGLDYYWSREFEQEQLDAFEEQVKWSVETRLPLMIHCRKGQNEMVQLLRRYKNDLPGGVFHCFTEDVAVARAALDLGFYISLSGILTFKSAQTLREVAAMVPLDRLLIETDSPYLAPVPHRGKTNNPSYVPLVAAELARLRQLDLPEMGRITSQNFTRLFAGVAA